MGSTAPEPPVQRASPNASGRASIATRRRVLAMHGGSQTARRSRHRIRISSAPSPPVRSRHSQTLSGGWHRNLGGDAGVRHTRCEQSTDSREDLRRGCIERGQAREPSRAPASSNHQNKYAAPESTTESLLGALPPSMFVPLLSSPFAPTTIVLPSSLRLTADPNRSPASATIGLT